MFPRGAAGSSDSAAAILRPIYEWLGMLMDALW